MTDPIARQPRGIPTGGRFAPAYRSEPAVALPSTSLSEAELEEAVADAAAEQEAALAELEADEELGRRLPRLP